MKKLLFIGSYSVGLFLNGQRIPNIGETVTAHEFFETFGGKGSNQAVTAAKLGGDVRFLCKIGRDRYGEDAVNMYKEVGLYGSGILVDDEALTSVSVILVDDKGRNAISIYLGANEKLTAAEAVDFLKNQPEKPFLVGFQLENNLDMVLESIRACADMGLDVLLDPAPAAPLPEWVYPCLTYIKPNEHEAALLSGITIKTPEDAFAAGRWFREKGVGTAIITLGEQGTVRVSAEGERYFPPVVVDAVDTTGAGDVFSGSLMKALADDLPLDEAIVYANCAASLSVTKPGVTEAVPTVAEVEALYRSRKEQQA